MKFLAVSGVRSVLVRSLLVASTFGISTGASADGGVLSPEALIRLSEVGLAEFSKSYGPDRYAEIYAITTAASEDGDGATVKYYYGAPADRVHATYFCHEHSPGTVDCHEVR